MSTAAAEQADKVGPTPGPWSVGPGNVVKSVTDLPGGGRQTRWVAQVVHCTPVVEGEQEANARLIAAAPDMLAALKKLISAYDLAVVRSDVIGFAHEAAVAAIAKAEAR